MKHRNEQLAPTRSVSSYPAASRPLRAAGPILALFLSVTVSGCATPPDSTSVIKARSALETAQRGNLVGEDSLDYREAQRHLAEAERLLEDGGSQELIDHEAEMARLHADVAVARTEAIAARTEINHYLDQARASTAETRVAVERAIRNTAAVNSQQTERGLVLTLGGVLFGFNSAELTDEARLSVARVAGFLIGLADRDALVEGHADNTGSAEYNLKLSLERAESIRAALVEFGVGEERMLAGGYGSQFPVASNETAEGRERNRRVEIVILRPGLTAAEALR